jgi:pimeloyl-ACP methyl ester carboxylesterase
MSKIKVNGASLNFQEQGSGEKTVLFVHGLLFNHRMFDAQVEALKSDYRCIAVDLRGQGDSEVTSDGYDIDNLTRDTVAFIEALGCGPCHFVGLSMGGFVGLRLAIHHPKLLRSLSLLDTSADPEPVENVFRYKMMAAIGRLFGFRPLMGRLLPIMFGADTLEDESRREILEYWKQQFRDNDKVGSSRAALGVIGREGVYPQLGQINTPTLIIVGEQDVATTKDKSERMHQAISRSELMVIPSAGHSSCVEKPAEVTRALREFIHSADDLDTTLIG